MGVGTEKVPSSSTKDSEDWGEIWGESEQQQWEQEVVSSWDKTSKFISRASRKILYVLESQKRLALTDITANNGGVPTEVKMNRGLPVFNSLEMACLTCTDTGDFLGCANYYPIEKSRRKNESKSVITMWSLKEPSRPKYFLRMWGKVSVIHIFVYGHVFIAGGYDGGLAIWDLDESTEYHKLYQDQVIRTATIDTSD